MEKIRRMIVTVISKINKRIVDYLDFFILVSTMIVIVTLY